eukprot:scaffold7792_cov19-Tisochrysis_lutea.AAC.2
MSFRPRCAREAAFAVVPLDGCVHERDNSDAYFCPLMDIYASVKAQTHAWLLFGPMCAPEAASAVVPNDENVHEHDSLQAQMALLCNLLAACVLLRGRATAR